MARSRVANSFSTLPTSPQSMKSTSEADSASERIRRATRSSWLIPDQVSSERKVALPSGRLASSCASPSSAIRASRCARSSALGASLPSTMAERLSLGADTRSRAEARSPQHPLLLRTGGEQGRQDAGELHAAERRIGQIEDPISPRHLQPPRVPSRLPRLRITSGPSRLAAAGSVAASPPARPGPRSS